MLDQLLVIVSVTSLVMVTPGPDMVLVLRNTFVGGRSAGLKTSGGILLIISRSILAFSTLKYAAAAYLIYLGIMSFRCAAKPLDTNVVEERRLDRTWFVQGFINNLLNPKGTLFYLGVFTMVITPETSASTMLLLIFTMMLISASFWLFFVHTLDRPIVRGCLERSQQTVNRIFGAVLLILGIRVASMSR